jgi:hypothetical protein
MYTYEIKVAFRDEICILCVHVVCMSLCFCKVLFDVHVTLELQWSGMNALSRQLMLQTFYITFIVWVVCEIKYCGFTLCVLCKQDVKVNNYIQLHLTFLISKRFHISLQLLTLLAEQDFKIVLRKLQFCI